MNESMGIVSAGTDDFAFSVEVRDISEPVSLRFSGSELVGKKKRMGLCMAACISLQ